MLPRCRPRCSPQSTADHQLGDAVPRCPAVPSRNMAGDGDQAELCITPCAVGSDPRSEVSPHPRLRGRLFGTGCKDPYDLSPHLPTVASRSPRTPLKRSHRPFYPEFEVDQGPTRPGRAVYYAESTCLEYTALSAQTDSALWHHRPVV